MLILCTSEPIKLTIELGQVGVRFCSIHHGLISNLSILVGQLVASSQPNWKLRLQVLSLNQMETFGVHQSGYSSHKKASNCIMDRGCYWLSKAPWHSLRTLILGNLSLR